MDRDYEKTAQNARGTDFLTPPAPPAAGLAPEWVAHANSDDGIRNQQRGGVWPPPPQNYDHTAYQTGKIPVTAGAARGFFFYRCLTYGIGFGAAYGGIIGLFIFVIGALYGLPIGATLGLALGLIDGVLLCVLAAHQVEKGVPVPIIARTICRTAPFATMAGGATLLMGYGLITGEGFGVFSSWFVIAIYAVAVVASWHAAWLAAKRFTEKYE